MSRKFAIVFGGSCLLTLVCSVAFLRSRTFLVPYYAQRMEDALAAHYETNEFEGGMLVFAYDNDYNDFEYFRDELVVLGEVAKL